MSNTFSQPAYPGASTLRAAIADDDVNQLPVLIIAAALNEDDRSSLENACIALSSHPNETIRGNAILGFGHIARRFQAIGDSVHEIVRRGTKDESEYVRGQAYAAADDLECFLGLTLANEASPNSK